MPDATASDAETEVEVYEDDLITPAEAIKRICHYVGTEFEAKAVIADAMHSGSVIAYVGKSYERTGGDPTDEWDVILKRAKLIGENISLDPDYWRLSPSWPEETRHWDWEAGNFVLMHSDDWGRRTISRVIPSGASACM